MPQALPTRRKPTMRTSDRLGAVLRLPLACINVAMTSEPQRGLPEDHQRMLWAKLEDIEADLGAIVAWLPESSLRYTLERTFWAAW